MKAFEVNFDGIVGPTHNYGGLAKGDLASEKHAFQASNPKEAALQGLKKMYLLMKLGIPQAVLPPHERPFIPLLKNLGFVGKEFEILERAHRDCPTIFRAAYSSSSMWAANAATVSPSIEAQDGRLQITPANLVNNLHRSLEAEINYQILKLIFSDKKHFHVHKPLFKDSDLADEGAANHNRFCSSYGAPGLQLFVYGRNSQDKENYLSHHLPRRQTLEASQAIARLHQLKPNAVLFAKQNPKAIDEGVFHNDVISVSNQTVFFYHEEAFEDTNTTITKLQKRSACPLTFLKVASAELSLKEAVRTYLFNSQLITLPEGSMALIAPFESRENNAAHQVLLRIIEEPNPIQFLHFIDCRQSMQNGGGPACLRLRVVLTEAERLACHQGIFLDEILYQNLVRWVEAHFRDRLTQGDLLDPSLLQESYTALDELSRLLHLGSIYSFQKV